jgi:hypothetical protein
MNFDYTYISIFGYPVFEPMVILTNLLFFILCCVYFKRLSSFSNTYANQMAWFMLLLGISTCFGAVGHAVHYQLGEAFFGAILFLMNAFSLFSIYFCFRAPYTYSQPGKEPSKRYIFLVLAWVIILLVISAIKGNFLIIKIHAGLVLLYSLIVHYLAYRRTNERGSAFVVLGIFISFLSIVVHSVKLSFHEWFNYKDIAHVIMIISLIVIYKGVRLNVLDVGNTETQNVRA